MNNAARIDYEVEDFRVIQSIMHQYAGINLHDGKQELVYSRLAKRVRALGLGSFKEYCAALGHDDAEILHCINSMTTNVTSFFREIHHFEFLQKELLAKAPNRPLRIWSAGCSSGEEPYSIAFTCDSFPHVDTCIVATDLDSEVLQRARNGVYDLKDVASMTDGDRRKWFLKGKDAHEGKVRVRPEFRESIDFYQLNLRNDWRHDEKFDVIFCRNVMIYFDKEFRDRLVRKFSENLHPGGYLILGHSESLFGLNSTLNVVGKTIHRKHVDRSLDTAKAAPGTMLR